MKTETEIKEMVKERYSQVALQNEGLAPGCCGSACGCEVENIMADDYTKLDGYNPDADLGLGCGLPTEFARIKKGDVVIDLGSGAGNDAFVALNETGETGQVIGIDFSPAMLERARKNAEALDISNVEFLEGDIEKIPLRDETADVIVSNCVLNLVPNKDAVIKEIYRVLKPGGHFSISDIVLGGRLPVNMQHAAEMYAGCVSGAIQKVDYLRLIKENGFKNITVQKERSINLPDEFLAEYLSSEEITAFRNSGTGIFSVTVFAEKPKQKECCGTDCCN